MKTERIKIDSPNRRSDHTELKDCSSDDGSQYKNIFKIEETKTPVVQLKENWEDPTVVVQQSRPTHRNRLYIRDINKFQV